RGPTRPQPAWMRSARGSRRSPSGWRAARKPEPAPRLAAAPQIVDSIFVIISAVSIAGRADRMASSMMMRLQTATAITPGQKGQPAGAAVDVADRRNDPHPAEPRKQPGDVAPAELGRRHPGDQVVVEGVEHEDDGHNDVQETVRPEAGPVEDPVAADEGDRRENLGAQRRNGRCSVGWLWHRTRSTIG